MQSSEARKSKSVLFRPAINNFSQAPKFVRTAVAENWANTDTFLDVGVLLRKLLRAKTAPVLLLPLQRGPLHGFYHFLIGYWLPVMAYALRKKPSRIAVVDSDPLNHWFDLVPGGPPEIVGRSDSIKIAYRSRFLGLAGKFRVRAYIGWDKWQDFHKRNLASIVTKVNLFLEGEEGIEPHRRPQILVIGRDYTPDYYAENLPTRYGVAKRNIPNLGGVVEELSDKFDVEFVDGAMVPPREMFAKCRTAELLIGQHGAGLANLIFLNKGAAVMEIGWPTIKQDNQSEIFRLLAGELGIKWCRPILQEDRFGEISATALEREITFAIEELGLSIVSSSKC